MGADAARNVHKETVVAACAVTAPLQKGKPHAQHSDPQCQRSARAQHDPRLSGETDARLTLYLRRAHRLTNPDPERVKSVEGDVLDREALGAATPGHNAVYANLSGDMKTQAEVVAAMHAAGLKRLIFISSVGIYGEMPGDLHSRVLDPYRDAAAVIEASDLDYTVLRPG